MAHQDGHTDTGWLHMEAGEVEDLPRFVDQLPLLVGVPLVGDRPGQGKDVEPDRSRVERGLGILPPADHQGVEVGT